MKLSMAALIVFFGMQTHALAGTPVIATLNADVTSQMVDLTDQKLEPIFETHIIQTTCTREVFDHTATSCHTTYGQSCSGGNVVCSGGGQSCSDGGQSCSSSNDSVCNSHGCTSVPRRTCHSTPGSCHSTPGVCHTTPQSCYPTTGQSCSNYAVTHTETYACEKSVTTQVGQKIVKTYNHKVEVSLTNATNIGASNLAVTLNAKEDGVLPSIAASFPGAILTYQIASISKDDRGEVVNLFEKVTINAVASGDLIRKVNSASMEQLELGSEAFKFTLKNGAGLENLLKLSVQLIRTPSVWFPRTIYDDSIESSKLGLVSAGTDMNAIIPYEKLDLASIGGKHTLDVTVKLNISGTVLNQRDFNTELAKEFNARIEKESPTF